MRLEYFQMIDRVVAFDEVAGTLAAQSTVPQESPIFEGHFPGHALMPGVLLIETMAQASGYLVLSRNGFSQMPFLAGVKEAKLRTFVEPGALLDVRAAIEHDGSGFAITKAEVRHAGARVCNAQLTFKILAFPAPELESMMRDEAARIGIAVEAPAS
jgi:3-hydroxyacyl-[acyl-carrier-protein] dehydratase